MALNKFEKQVQQKLSNREMKPSANSWDRLDAMLSVEEKPKEKGFFWINIAASFIVFASVGYYFYNQNTIVAPVKEESIIVDENSEFRIQNPENKEDKTGKKQETRSKKQEVLVENDMLIKENKNSSISKQQLASISEANNQQPTTNNQKEVSIINPSSNKESTQTSLVDNTQPTCRKYISAQELLAQVENSNLKMQPNLVKSKTKIKVDAKALLSNAESELSQTFRENVLNKLNKNYHELATAIANRNYEE